jgi:uroporphyrinogen III methyltransferase/synthase
VTGTSAEHFAGAGKVVHQPLISIEKIWPNSYAKGIIDDLHRFDWLFFTSRYSVGFFFEWLEELGCDSRYLSTLKIAAVGKVTANALAEHGIRADLIPDEESSEGLLREIAERNIAPGKVLLPRSEAGLPVLPEGLEKMGWEVTVLPLYQNRMPEGLQALELKQFNKIVFSSPSCVSNFLHLYGSFPDHTEFIFRGRETEKKFNQLQNQAI